MLGREQVERIRAAMGLGPLDWSREETEMAEVRCGRCGAPLEEGQGAGVLVGRAAGAGAEPYSVPLCLTHAAEVCLLLEHYRAHRIAVLAGNRLCVALTDRDVTG